MEYKLVCITTLAALAILASYALGVVEPWYEGHMSFEEIECDECIEGADVKCNDNYDACEVVTHEYLNYRLGDYPTYLQALDALNRALGAWGCGWDLIDISDEGLCMPAGLPHCDITFCNRTFVGNLCKGGIYKYVGPCGLNMEYYATVNPHIDIVYVRECRCT